MRYDSAPSSSIDAPGFMVVEPHQHDERWEAGCEGSIRVEEVNRESPSLMDNLNQSIRRSRKRAYSEQGAGS